MCVWVSILRYLALAKEFINELTLFIRVSEMRYIQISTYKLLTFKNACQEEVVFVFSCLHIFSDAAICYFSKSLLALSLENHYVVLECSIRVAAREELNVV